MPNIPQAFRSLIAEYRSLLRTSYRFLDPHLRWNFMQSKGWIVLTFWGRTLLRDPESCARQVADLLRTQQRFLGR
jgi:hypothetical protein